MFRWLWKPDPPIQPDPPSGEQAEHEQARQRILDQADQMRAGEHWTNQRAEAYPCTRGRRGRHGRGDRDAR